jgi:hypothetical protein
VVGRARDDYIDRFVRVTDGWNFHSESRKWSIRKLVFNIRSILKPTP